MSAGLGVGSLAASHPGSGSHHGSSHHGNSAFQMGALQQALPSVQTGSPTSDSFVGELSPPAAIGLTMERCVLAPTACWPAVNLGDSSVHAP